MVAVRPLAPAAAHRGRAWACCPFLALAALAVLALSGCSRAHGGVQRLYIYNWADYIGRNTVAKFERRTGIDVIYDTYDSDETLEAKLMAAEDYANWGLFRQKSAQITCIVPSITERDHVHFVDGADGGYTMAATAMKARRLLKTARAA